MLPVPSPASRRSALPRLVAAALLIVLLACGPPSHADVDLQSHDLRSQLSIGYSLLYQEADGIPKLNWLLMFKEKTPEMGQATRDLIGFYQQLAERMRQLSKEHPAMRIDVSPMSEIEGDSRKAIGKDLAKDLAPLVGKSGVDFEREALLNFHDGLNEQRHLVGVMIGMETDPPLKRFLETTQSELDDHYARIGALLNRDYFTH